MFNRAIPSADNILSCHAVSVCNLINSSATVKFFLRVKLIFDLLPTPQLQSLYSVCSVIAFYYVQS